MATARRRFRRRAVARTWPTGALVAVAAVLLPLVVVAVAVVVRSRGYIPVGDWALTELRVRDVGRHPVVAGLYSRDGWSHPGPMVFYLMAPLYRLGGSASVTIAVAAVIVNGVAITGMAAVARRRGGLPMLLCTLVAVSLLVRTLSITFLADPWNPFITVLPFALMVFLAWAAACGETWALPASAVTATFLAQTHVGFVVLALPLFVVGAAWLVVGVLRARDGAPPRARLVRASALTIFLLVLLWAPVLADVVNGAPDNLNRVVDWFRDADGGTHTAIQGARMLFGELGGRPEWLVSHRAPLDVSGESVFLYRAPPPWMLLFVIGAAVAFRRVRSGDGNRLVAIWGVAFVLGVLAIQRTVGLVFDYRTRWTWVVGAVAFVVVTWAAWVFAVSRRPSVQRVLVGVAAVALAVVNVVNLVVAVGAEPPRAADSDVMAALVPPVLRAVDGANGPVLIDDGRFSSSSDYSRGLLLQLERHGVDARLLPKDRAIVGDHRVVEGRPVARRLVIAQDDEVAARDGEPELRRIAGWTSVTAAQERAFRRESARLDRLVADGVIDPVDRALRLKEIGLATHDDALAWAVAVYVAES